MLREAHAFWKPYDSRGFEADSLCDEALAPAQCGLVIWCTGGEGSWALANTEGPLAGFGGHEMNEGQLN